VGAPLPRRRGASAPAGPGLGAVRIIAGSRKGARIFAPKGLDTRPTADRVREAAFNLLGPGAAEDATVLDLFAGSGAMGLEALSRGAASAVFVESDREACRTIERNLAKLGLTGATVLCRDAFQVLTAGSRTYDLVLCDPPYGFKGNARLAGYLKRALAPNGLLVYETGAKEQLELEGLQVRTSRTYGSARLTLFEL
jgi:16S rRNA (guanine966-N2)-methyltransferase